MIKKSVLFLLFLAFSKYLEVSKNKGVIVDRIKVKSFMKGLNSDMVPAIQAQDRPVSDVMIGKICSLSQKLGQS
jgi:hypothetical protein